MAQLGYVLLVVLAFGALIFVHELGHFLAAKRVGVRVEVFSLGFGPFLLSWKRGDTTYAISLVLFGGYVKMTGQAEAGVKDGPAPPYDFNAKPPLRRALILVCGVAMNLIFAYVLFVAVYLVGMRVTPPKTGTLAPTDPAYEAGLRTGDEFVDIGGRRPSTYDDVIFLFTTGKGKKKAVVRRGEERLELELPAFGDHEKAVKAYPLPIIEWPLHIGCTGERRIVIAKVVPDKPAEKAGVQLGDIILSVESKEVVDVPGLRKAIASKGGAEVEVVIVRAGKVLPGVAIQPVPNEREEKAEAPFVIGVGTGPPMCVGEVQPGSPAERAGLRRFDVIELQSIEKLGGGRFSLSWRRGQEKVGPEVLATSPDYAAFTVREGERSLDRRGLFWRDGRPGAVLKGFSECWRAIGRTVAVLRGLVTGKLRLRKTLGGPLTIARLAYRSAEAGGDYYVWQLALLSTMIGIFNLFPVPPLDGGLLVFVAMEKLRGRPAARKTRELAQTIGMILLLVLIVCVTWFDVVRLWGAG